MSIGGRGYDLTGTTPEFPVDECPPCEDCDSPVMVSTTSLNNGNVGVPYSQQAFANGGTGPYTWNNAGVAWPDGMSIDVDTGLVGGTPTTPAEVIIVLKVTDALGRTGWQNAPLTIEA